MTDLEQKVLKESQEEMKREVGKIGQSLTRILLLGGPVYVEALLSSLQEANNQMKSQLKMNVTAGFKNEN